MVGIDISTRAPRPAVGPAQHAYLRLIGTAAADGTTNCVDAFREHPLELNERTYVS